ncbi:MAG TPA: diacylglycerol kinase family protein [Candidatus Acidoferrales bacterium]|nr:diacylglycerol kinase family protein [Candidatus Acidoferrales bacterium]
MLENVHTAVLIYNPASGRRRHRRFAEIEEAARILQSSGIAAELAPTDSRGAATDIARKAVTNKIDLAIVCGGDGTINEVVNGLAGSQVPLAVLPAGTANILAKELGIPWDIPAAARLIRGSTTQRIALGAVMNATAEGDADPSQGCRYFMSVAGAGPDGEIVHAVNPELKDQTGIIAYWAAGARQLFQYRFPEMAIASSQNRGNATLLVVGRTVNYGGPFKITTGANLFDDEFEIVTFNTRNRWRYVGALLPLWLGRLRSVAGIRAWKTRELTCAPANGSTIYAQVDGELAGTLPLHFRVVPDALTLVVPATANK